MMQKSGKNPNDPAHHLEEVLRSCRRKWFRFVLRIVQNYADAEDVLQEGFCRVLAAKKDFFDEDQARMYLARTISNTAIEIYHTRRREKASCLPAHEYPLVDHRRATPQLMLERREDSLTRARVLALMQEGLHGLPVKQYEALRMTVMDAAGSSIRDVGEVHGIAYSTLRHRRNKGLKRLYRFITRALRNGASL